MNILTNGCSFSRGPGSWPYLIADMNNANLVNLSQAGAGIDYITQTTISELNFRSYDLVCIMWTGPERTDIKIDDISFFSETIYTSYYQSKQNDWPEKIIEPFDDQSIVEKNWVFGCGHKNGDKHILESGLFTQLYKHKNYAQHIEHLLFNMVSLQSYLKVNKIPYVFSFFKNYLKDIMQFPLFDSIDTSHLCLENNIFDLTQENKWLADDGLHPSEKAHKEYASILNKFIKKII